MDSVSEQLKKFQITPDPLKDQFFLTDEKILDKIVELSDLKNSDVVLEIGVGTGNLTRKILKESGIDDAHLEKQPDNLEIYERVSGKITS